LYIPSFNEVNDLAVMHSLIKNHPFAMWTAMADGELVVNHIPFVLHESKGEFGTLIGHVARKNTIWQTCSREISSAIVFQGVNAYISPSWYASKHEHGKAVPTWNYAAVHAWGIPKIIEDRECLLAHVEEITDFHEKDQKLPWKVSDVPEEYINKLLAVIVGIEIPITRLQGKMKLGQNKSDADKLGMVAGLMSKHTDQTKYLAQMLNQHISESKQSNKT